MPTIQLTIMVAGIVGWMGLAVVVTKNKFYMDSPQIRLNSAVVVVS